MNNILNKYQIWINQDLQNELSHDSERAEGQSRNNAHQIPPTAKPITSSPKTATALPAVPVHSLQINPSRRFGKPPPSSLVALPRSGAKIRSPHLGKHDPDPTSLLLASLVVDVSSSTLVGWPGAPESIRNFSRFLFSLKNTSMHRLFVLRVLLTFSLCCGLWAIWSKCYFPLKSVRRLLPRISLLHASWSACLCQFMFPAKFRFDSASRSVIMDHSFLLELLLACIDRRDWETTWQYA